MAQRPKQTKDEILANVTVPEHSLGSKYVHHIKMIWEGSIDDKQKLFAEKCAREFVLLAYFNKYMEILYRNDDVLESILSEEANIHVEDVTSTLDHVMSGRVGQMNMRKDVLEYLLDPRRILVHDRLIQEAADYVAISFEDAKQKMMNYIFPHRIFYEEHLPVLARLAMFVEAAQPIIGVNADKALQKSILNAAEKSDPKVKSDIRKKLSTAGYVLP
ncbi:hypothetical protein ACLMJK_001375 [Lecanora helva]